MTWKSSKNFARLPISKDMHENIMVRFKKNSWFQLSLSQHRAMKATSPTGSYSNWFIKLLRKNWQLHPSKYGNPHNNCTKVEGSGPHPHFRNEEMKEQRWNDSPKFAELVGAAAKNRSVSAADLGLFLFFCSTLCCGTHFEVKPSYTWASSQGWWGVGCVCCHTGPWEAVPWGSSGWQLWFQNGFSG